MAQNVEVMSFAEALKIADDTKSVLLGNGFSIAQGGNSFAYSSLLEKCDLQQDHPIRSVFRTLDTVDFEEVMFALNYASKILLAYGDDEKSKEFAAHAEELRESLIRAVHLVHPGAQFDIPILQRQRCAEFLRSFEQIFTTNYDLLLYWVIVKELKSMFRDGFGLGREENGFRNFDPKGYCSTYYLHGALHLFLSDRREAQKRIVENQTIIDDIADSIRARRQLPLFVSEGTSSQKMARINSVPYLRSCYEELLALTGSLFVFGLSAAERDRHIFDAIFKSSITKVFFCIYEPEKGYAQTRERLAAYSAQNRRAKVVYVDAGTVTVW